MHIINTKQSRRETLKGLMDMEALTLFPKFLFSKNEETFPLHIVGLGSAGSNIAEFLCHKGVKAKFTCITNPKHENLAKEINYIHFTAPGKTLFNNGEEIFRRVDMHQAIEIPKTVFDVFESHEKFILFSGLGSYTGTFMTEAFTLMLHQKKKSFQTISTLPFSFEGPIKNQLAKNTVQKLTHIDGFRYFALDEIKTEIAHLNIQDAFMKANETLYQFYLNHKS